MIIKTFDLQKLKTTKAKKFLFYGENEGHKDQIINEYFLKKFKNNTNKYDENEVLNNYDSFVSNLLNKSFFEENKLIIISRCSEKIFNLIEEIITKDIQEITLIINSGPLDKNSNIRIFFEKNEDTVCIPFYADDTKTLNLFAYNFFKNKRIFVSQETINLLVERCRGSRKSLNTELTKIENFSNNKEKITNEEILKISNLAEDYSVSELINNCLSKNLKKTINILNENNYSSEDCILILRTMLIKAKRLLKLKKEVEKSKNIDQVIFSFRPLIFWKEKEIIKKQILNCSSEEIENLIYQINVIEIQVKKNFSNSFNIISDFILNKSIKSNNLSL
jgi:DNA polymerase-3 subunit delta